MTAPFALHHSAREIALALGIAPNYVRVVRLRALRKLREALSQEEPS
ncbi:MAG TPA: hypothetical protein VL242_54250 [Sorangium sp.]|nr:hypothetical protein [Sorangium sp.]